MCCPGWSPAFWPSPPWPSPWPTSWPAVVVDEVGQLQVGDRDRDEVLALAPDQLLMAQVFAQLLADPAAHDLAEAVEVGLYSHAIPSQLRSFTSPRAKMLATKCRTSVAQESQ